MVPGVARRAEPSSPGRPGYGAASDQNTCTSKWPPDAHSAQMIPARGSVTGSVAWTFAAFAYGIRVFPAAEATRWRAVSGV